MKLIPPQILQKIGIHPGLNNVVDNIGWLFMDKILRMVVGLAVGVWIARYLGPEQFGQLNYAIAFVSLFGALAALGLNGVVVRDIVREPSSASVTLGTAFTLRVIGSLSAVTLMICTITLLRPDDDLTKILVAILGFSLVFKSSDVIKYWYESQVESRYTVWVENSVFLLIAAVKIVLILTHAPLIAFVIIVLVESALVSLGLFGIYLRRERKLSTWSLKIERVKSLLNDSWLLVLSSVAVMIYMRIDQIMLGEMVGDEAVGVYSAALRISEVWYMFPSIIVASLFPAIIRSKKISEKLYLERMQKLFDFMTGLSIMIAVVIALSASWLIQLLYGSGYNEAAGVLMIHIWACVFVFLGVASGKWYLVEGYQLLAFQRTALGALINIILNYYLIDIYGPQGAAFATVMANFMAAFLFDAFNSKTRNMFYMKVRSMNLIRVINAQRKNLT